MSMEWDPQAVTTEEEVAEADDPLAELDEETRTRVQAAIEAEATAKAEAAIASMKGRWGRGSQLLAEQAGIVLDEHGEPAVRDPSKFQSFSQRFRGETPALPEVQPAQAAAPTDEEVTEWDTPAEVARKVSARFQREQAGLVQAAVAPLMEQIQQLRGYLGQQHLQTQTAQALPCLEEFGLTSVAEDPDFRAAFEKALGGVPIEARNEEMIDGAAMVALAMARRAKIARGESFRVAAAAAPPPTNGVNPAAQRAQANRAGLPAASLARSTTVAPAGPADYTRDEQIAAELAGLTVEEFRLASAPPDALTGHSALYDTYNTARRQPAGTRR